MPLPGLPLRRPKKYVGPEPGKRGPHKLEHTLVRDDLDEIWEKFSCVCGSKGVVYVKSRNDAELHLTPI